MTSIYLNYSRDNPCPYHRFLLPARYMSQDFDPEQYRIECGPLFPHGYDWYGAHGIVPQDYIMEIGLWKKRGAKFLWSLDDDFQSIPDWNPAKPGPREMASWELCKYLADMILVSTPALARTFADVKEKVVCAPNLLEVGSYMPSRVRQLTQAPGMSELSVEKPLRIVWVGGSTHREDIDHISQALDVVMRKFGPKEIHLIFAGLCPGASLLRDWAHRGLIWKPGVPFPQYHQLVQTLDPDIWIAPQVDIPFNHSKSNLRIMEGWSMLGAVVASPVGEYACIQSGLDGRYASTTEEWVNVLSRLITDHSYRLNLAIAGRERASLEYNWSKWECRRPWHEAFARILDCDLPSRKD